MTAAAFHLAALAAEFPLPLDRYPPVPEGGLARALADRVRAEPFNLVATGIFFLAVLHTFLTPLFRSWARRVESRHRGRPREGRAPMVDEEGKEIAEVSFGGQILHFLGEVEAVFGIWAVVLLAALTLHGSWTAAAGYIGHQVDFTEPIFVMVIMGLASARPMMRCAERCLEVFASVGGGTVGAWWIAILIIGPLLGSLITEPGAMTISALLLARHFYPYRPSPRLGYATLGLLFVNVSVGGMLTNFAAPPVVMASGPWRWTLPYVFAHFGWKAFSGIVASTLGYFALFRREFARLDEAYLRIGRTETQGRRRRHPPLDHRGAGRLHGLHRQRGPLSRPAHRRIPLLPGFRPGHGAPPEEAGPEAAAAGRLFPAGLVVHGSLQGWWLDPVLKSLGRVPLFIAATVLTSFNDNAAITYLARWFRASPPRSNTP